jgi:hypothetical protein
MEGQKKECGLKARKSAKKSYTEEWWVIIAKVLQNLMLLVQLRANTQIWSHGVPSKKLN